jgi:hypothetical protein
MEISPYGIALIGVGSVALGALLGAWVTYRFSISLANINARRFAGMKLREAFGPELAKLRHSQTLIPGAVESSAVLAGAFLKHEIAVNEFRFFLRDAELEAFNEAWQNYYRGPEDHRPDFYQYTNFSPEEIKEAIAHIETILAFTESKIT